MSKIIFNEIQIKLLKSNPPNVEHVSERSISYIALYISLLSMGLTCN